MSVAEESPQSGHEPAGEVESTPYPPRVRLEKLIGREFAQRLLVALAPIQRRRGTPPS